MRGLLLTGSIIFSALSFGAAEKFTSLHLLTKAISTPYVIDALGESEVISIGLEGIDKYNRRTFKIEAGDCSLIVRISETGNTKFLNKVGQCQ